MKPGSQLWLWEKGYFLSCSRKEEQLDAKTGKGGRLKGGK